MSHFLRRIMLSPVTCLTSPRLSTLSRNQQDFREKAKRKSIPITGPELPRGFQEVKVKQSRYRPGVAQRVPGS